MGPEAHATRNLCAIFCYQSADILSDQHVGTALLITLNARRFRRRHYEWIASSACAVLLGTEMDHLFFSNDSAVTQHNSRYLFHGSLDLYLLMDYYLL